MLIGILIAGIQILPTMFFWSETARSAGVLIENRAEWALSIWRLPELIAPGFFSGTPGESLVAPVYMWLGNPGNALPYSILDQRLYRHDRHCPRCLWHVE